jgi:hypothetical protein
MKVCSQIKKGIQKSKLEIKQIRINQGSVWTLFSAMLLRSNLQIASQRPLIIRSDTVD